MSNREHLSYTVLAELHRGKTVTLGGKRIRKALGKLVPGDMFVAERNNGPRLLICKEADEVVWRVKPTEITAGVYDLHECVRVRILSMFHVVIQDGPVQVDFQRTPDRQRALAIRDQLLGHAPSCDVFVVEIET